MQNKWLLRTVEDETTVSRIQKELNDLPEPLARALVIRGVDTFEKARTFFRPAREMLHDPFLMKDMQAAAKRVVQALEANERIMVYGDYDVDGTTSTTLMVRFLREQGAEVSYFIPHRFKDGYGLSQRGIEKAAEQEAGLIIALDCGITGHKMAAYVQELGMDLIICDHHTPGETVPEAVAVLDPKRADCEYPFKELSGCGVGFKLVQAVLQLRGQPTEQAFAYGELLALSIASDIVPIGGENRVLMWEGLQAMQEEQVSPGVKALADKANLDLAQSSTSRIVFGLGPRINAAGRMDSAEKAVQLLLTQNSQEANRLAAALDSFNKERRSQGRAMWQRAAAQAEQMLEEKGYDGLVLFGEDWHQGIVGIVASRIAEDFYRPTIILCDAGDGRIKGSARSITGFNIYDALCECEELLERFGGHDYAAGMTLKRENLAEFREKFSEVVSSRITEDLLVPKIKVDASLDLREVKEGVQSRFWKVLKQFEPCGPSNRRPVFMSQNLQVAGKPRTIGKENKHLKFSVCQEENTPPVPVIGFNMGDHLETLQQGRPIDLLFKLDENRWKGRVNLQLRAEDLRISKE